MSLHLADKYFDPSVDKTVKKIRGKRGKYKPRKKKSNEDTLHQSRNENDDVSRNESISLEKGQVQNRNIVQKEGKVTF